MRWIVLTLMMATPVAAAECPAAPDHGDVLASLIAKVQSVQNEAAARQINREMWLLWRDAPDARAQRLLDCGIERREAYDYDAALGELVVYCPDYVEGYKQRAFVEVYGQITPARWGIWSMRWNYSQPILRHYPARRCP
ncbi:MAG: hypothetical protein L3J30_13170 [Marinosulfonomonas sp.]|nr:hypothetical protein [Marinosulfonomonas sp.]